MITDSGMLSAFQMAAGVSAVQLSLFIRTLVLAMIFLWAVWVLYGAIHAWQHNEMDELMEAFKRLARIALIVTLVMVLVFIP
jgi:integrating conjugative element protein (TIGR03758 family)